MEAGLGGATGTGLWEAVRGIRRAVNRAADPVAAFLRDERTTFAVAAAFVFTGVSLMAADADLPQWYLVLLVVFAFKIAVNYRSCSVSYAECKLRGVGRERGVVDSLVNGITDLRRKHGFIALTIIYAIVVALYYFVYRGQRLAH